MARVEYRPEHAIGPLVRCHLARLRHPRTTMSLRSVDILSPELLRQLQSRSVARRLPRGVELYARGSKADAIFFVVSGAIKLTLTSAAGREAVISMIEAGNWFGELSLFIDEPRVHDARAVTDSSLLIVSSAAVHEIVDQQPKYLLDFMRLICMRYKAALQRIDASILVPLETRIARHLLIVERKHGADAAGSTGLKLSQEELGQMLGVSRQSVNRLLKDWESQGILLLAYGRIIVKRLDALQRLAQ